MRVLFVLPSLEKLAGSERVVQTLSATLRQRGHHAEIIVLKKFNPNIASTFECKIYELKKLWIFKHILNDKGSLIRLLNSRLKKETSFDLILSNVYSDNAINIDKDNVFYILHNDYRGETAMLDDPSHYIVKKKNQLQKYFNKKNVVTVSKQVADNLTQFFDVKPNQVQPIYNSVDIKFIRKLALQKNNKIPKEPYILFAGRNDAQKGIDILLKAFKKFSANNTTKLLLLTESPESLLLKIKSLNLENSIILLPFQKNPYPFMKQAKLFVMASYYEAFGLTIAEALACGTPVVSTDCYSGPNEILTHGLEKWLVPVGDADALAAKMLEAINTSITIPEVIFEPFDPDTVAKQYENLVSKA